MMQLSPFPADADRPWRGVWVYTSHAIEQHLRSPVFWLMALGLMVVVAGPALTGTGRRPQLQVAVVDAALLDQIRTLDLPQFELRSEADQSANVWLELGGDSVGNLAPRLVLRSGEGNQARQQADDLVKRLRRELVLSADGLPPEVPEAKSGEGLGELAAVAAPSAVGLISLLGAFSGLGAALQAARSRDEEYFAVLRLGTPTAVLFFGTLAEQALLGLLWSLPLLALALLVLGLSTGLQAFDADGRAAVGLVAVPLLALAGTVAAFCSAAAAGSLAGTVVRSRWGTAGAGQVLQLVLIVGTTLSAFALSGPASELIWALALPGFGAAVAAKGLSDGLALGWVVATVPVQLVWALVGLRVGTWAHGLDENLLSEVQLRIRRFRRAS